MILSSNASVAILKVEKIAWNRAIEVEAVVKFDERGRDWHEARAVHKHPGR